ncbi:MAG: GNAT family N-acetyltransferase [Chloroflexi bacterium]|nr:GNAT family N-acetyltransferase [Chloroflexota bacterium]
MEHGKRFNANEVSSGKLNPSDIHHIAEWIYQIPLYQRYRLTPDIMKASLETALAHGDWLHVISIQDVAVGFAWCLPQGTFSVSPYLRLIAVHPGEQGKGIGPLLLREAESWAREIQGSLTLLVSDFNHSAQRFYRREGYRETGRIPRLVLDDVDEIIYHKALEE